MRNNSHCKSVNQTERYAKKLNQQKKNKHFKLRGKSCCPGNEIQTVKYHATRAKYGKGELENKHILKRS